LFGFLSNLWFKTDAATRRGRPKMVRRQTE
jgi:hypothetical protein